MLEILFGWQYTLTSTSCISIKLKPLLIFLFLTIFMDSSVCRIPSCYRLTHCQWMTASYTIFFICWCMLMQFVILKRKLLTGMNHYVALVYSSSSMQVLPLQTVVVIKSGIWLCKISILNRCFFLLVFFSFLMFHKYFIKEI